jgi:hypothetical protein
MNTYYNNSDGQQIFDRHVGLFPFFALLLWRALIYSPLLLTGYILTRLFLPHSAPGYYWVGAIVGLAMLIYCLLFLLKGWAMALRHRGYDIWVGIVGIGWLYTSMMPGIMTYDLLSGWMHDKTLYEKFFHYAFGAGVGILSAWRYHWLTDIVPARLWFFYSVGLRMGGWRAGNAQS